MKILVLSCDNHADTFDAFHHCMEKYWKNHPEVIYKTETVTNPYYRTIMVDEPLNRWSVGTQKALSRIEDDKVLIMVDDCFIRCPVDTDRISYALSHFKSNTACFNLEKSFDLRDTECGLEGFKKRPHGGMWEVSIMCGIWDREKLMNVLNVVGSPWDIERIQPNCGYDYYINSGDYIIDWGYRYGVYTGITGGKWCRNMIPFFESEGISIDWSRRGVHE